MKWSKITKGEKRLNSIRDFKISGIQESIFNGEYDDAIDMIKKKYASKDLTADEQLKLIILDSNIKYRQGRYKEALILAEEALEKCHNHKDFLLETDALIEVASSLYRLGRFNESLVLVELGEKILQKHTNVETLQSNSRKGRLINTKAYIYLYTGQIDQALKFYLKNIPFLEKNANKEHIATALINMGLIYRSKGNLDRALSYCEEGLKLREKIGNKQDVAIALNNFGLILQAKGEYDRALDCFRKSLTSFEYVNNKHLIAMSLNNIGLIFLEKSNFDNAFRNFKKALFFFTEIGNKYNIASATNNLGIISHQKGDFNQALEYMKQSLEAIKEIGNEELTAYSLYNIGCIYHQKRNLPLSLDYLKQSLLIREKLDNKISISEILFELIYVFVDMNSTNHARKYLKTLQEINAESKNKLINQLALVGEGLILKNSKRARDFGRAEELLEQVTNEEIIKLEVTILAMLNLCDILLKELTLSNENEIFNDFNTLVKRLYEIAKEQKSHWLQAETLWLKAKLKLVNMEPLEAQQLLTQAEQITKDKGLKRLAMKISSELDDILSQYDEKEMLTNKEVPLSQRMKSVNLEGIVKTISRMGDVDVSKKSIETPILLLIMTTDGLAIFSKQFTLDKLDDLQIGGFLSSMNNFLQRTIAPKGTIDRIKYLDHTLLFKSIENILFCYIFKGESYFAHEKINNFLKTFHDSSPIWQYINEFLQTGQQFNPEETLIINNLIDEIFLVNSLE